MKLKDACSLEKSYDQPREHIKKQRHYFANKGLSSQSYVFPVVMYGCESWTEKKAECWRIDGFELRCWRRLLRVPWIARRSNQFILKEISPEYSLEGLMLKLKLQYFGHLMWRTDSFVKPLMLEKIEGGRRGQRGWDSWMALPTQWIWVWINSGSWWWTARPGMLQSMGLQRVGQDWVTELNWTDDSWFTMLCQFHMYRKVKQPYIYLYPLFLRFSTEDRNAKKKKSKIFKL